MIFDEGDRVVYCGELPTLESRAGTVFRANPTFVTVEFDHELGRTRIVYAHNLRLEKNPMSIKQFVKDTITNIFPKTTSDNGALVKELLVASTAATVANARKDKAKKAIIAAGLVDSEYAPGEVEAYRDKQFVLTAKTKEPTQKLDQAILREALNKAGLSKAKIDKAFVEATVSNKPATSYEVTEL